MRMRHVVAGSLVFAALGAGCGDDVDDAGVEWPRRDLKIMEPADPGGGWDTTAREMARVIEDGDLVGDLIAAALVDEYRLFVYPVVLGRGRRLFEDAIDVPRLRLVETRPFRSGLVLMRYRTA